MTNAQTAIVVGIVLLIGMAIDSGVAALERRKSRKAWLAKRRMIIKRLHDKRHKSL
jgi:hypothetical protein